MNARPEGLVVIFFVTPPGLVGWRATLLTWGRVSIAERSMEYRNHVLRACRRGSADFFCSTYIIDQLVRPIALSVFGEAPQVNDSIYWMLLLRLLPVFG